MEEKTTRELVYETNRDVKWICRALARMEAQDEEFEARIRALERLSGGEGRRRAAALDGECRGRRGRRRGGGGDCEGAGRGVDRLSCSGSPRRGRAPPGVAPGRRGVSGLHLCTCLHLVCTYLCTRTNLLLRLISGSAGRDWVSSRRLHQDGFHRHPGPGHPPLQEGSPFLVQMVQMTTLISTYLSLSTSYGTILTVPASIFVCTFPEIPVQTWCKGVSMIAGGFLVSPHQHHSESPKPALNVNSSCATSSPAGPASSAQTLQTP